MLSKLPTCKCGAAMVSDGVQEIASGYYEFFICPSCDAEAKKKVEAPKAQDDGLEWEEW